MPARLAEIARLIGAGAAAEAVASAHTLVDAGPAVPSSWHALGMALAAAREYETACDALQQALALAPHTFTWRRDLGALHVLLQRWPEAVRDLEAALGLDPEDEATLIYLARAKAALKRFDEARELLRTAVALHPGSAAAWEDLARIEHTLDNPDAALACMDRAVALNPDDFQLRVDQALACQSAGQHRRLLECAARACALPDRHAAAHSALCTALLHSPGSSATGLRMFHEQWCGNRPAATFPPRQAWPSGNLRVGFLTGEFTSAAAHLFMAGFFHEIVKRPLEIFCYHTRAAPHPLCDYYRALVPHWAEVQSFDDDGIEALVRSDAIQVLFDMSGHHPDNRLPLFARRLAPVQATWLHYPGTTGVANIDYLITDAWLSPAGTEGEYTETLVRLPSGAIVYTPPAEAPAVQPLPALTAGGMTFGLFQRPSKLNADVYDAVAGVLLAAPRSRLLVHHSVAGYDAEDSPARRRVRDQFARRGVEPGRIDFAGPRGFVAHLELLHRVDIALDSFPYSGHTTTSEALWMGVPVVTLSGARHAGRVSAALLARLGLDHWVARTPGEYVDIARRQAAAPQDLALLRQTLRARMAASPLVDAPALAREMESALHCMWRRYAPNA